jgi:muconolactone delta-isomerase
VNKSPGDWLNPHDWQALAEQEAREALVVLEYETWQRDRVRSMAAHPSAGECTS